MSGEVVHLFTIENDKMEGTNWASERSRQR
jgi:hypothetical protein